MGIDGIDQGLVTGEQITFNPPAERALVYLNLQQMGKKTEEIVEICEVFCGFNYRTDDEARELLRTHTRDQLMTMYKQFLAEGNRGIADGTADDLRTYFDV